MSYTHPGLFYVEPQANFVSPDIFSQPVFLDASNNEIGRIMIKGDGGHWGDLANLLGDGYEEAGRKLGKFIKKAVRSNPN